jgi:hypothetical protein
MLVERQLALAVSGEPSSASASGLSLPEGSQERSAAWLTAGSASGSGVSAASLRDAARDAAVMTRNLNEQTDALAGRRRKRAWLVTLGVLVSLAAVVAYVVRRPAPTFKAEASVRPAARETMLVAPPTNVILELRAEPDSAQLFLDGQLLPSNPASKRLTVDGRAHELRAVAAGYVPASSSFTPARDAVLSITLAKSAAPDSSDSPAAPQLKRSTAAPKSVFRHQPTAKAVDCAQAFFVDADGIKKLRPECL